MSAVPRIEVKGVTDAQLTGRTVLLTGAAGGLGRTQAVALGASGAKLLLLDRKEAAWKELSSALATAGVEGSTLIEHDLRDLEATKVLAHRLGEAAGITVLINNAAVILAQPLEAIECSGLEEMFQVNSIAPLLLAQGLAPAMKARGYGKIINLCSVTLHGSWPDFAAYSATKGALLALTRALARELGPFGLRVNAVSPGAILSDAEARVFGDDWPRYDAWVLERQCLKSRGRPEDIANAIVYLASAQSDYITGQNIEVDGGW